MRTYGTIFLKDGYWNIQAEPQVMIKLKSLFSKIKKQDLGTVKLLNTPENACDLEWFLMRYPLHNTDEEILAENSAKYKKTLSELEQILKPKYKPKGVYRMVKPPRHYQVVSDQILSRRGFLLNADDIGLGKTITGLCSMTDPNKLPALVTVQPHLQIHWKEKIEEFIPQLRIHIIKTRKIYVLPKADVYIITYNKIHAWAEVLSGFIRYTVYDEIQELRGTETDKYAGANFVNQRARYKLGLSGSPVYNYGDEMFNIMDNLHNGCLGDKDEFLREWAEWQGRHYKITNPKAFGAYLLENFLMIRRTAEEVGVEMPKEQKTIQEIPYDTDILNDTKNATIELAKLVLQGKFGESGQAAMEFDVRLRQQTGIAKAPFVAELAKMTLDKEQNLMIVAWHREVWDIYMELLKDYNPVLYTGTESTKKKDLAKKMFISGESKVFLMSLRSGTGLDGIQTVCNQIIHGELDYSPKVHEQCTGRLKRPGQTKPVMSIFPVADGGSDPFLVELLGLKNSQSDGILNPKKETSDIFTGVNSSGNRVTELAKYYLSKYQ